MLRDRLHENQEKSAYKIKALPSLHMLHIEQYALFNSLNLWRKSQLNTMYTYRFQIYVKDFDINQSIIIFQSF